MNNILTMNLKFFGENDKDFFTNAFNEAYNIGEEDNIPDTSSEPVEDAESVSNVEQVEEPVVEDKTPQQPSKEEIRALYEQYFGKPNETHQEEKAPELDEETKSAVELFKYLQSNPHLVQAMREVDAEGYKNLNNYIPDEVTQKFNQIEEYIQEQKYEKYISDLKNKFEDFDEEKVLEYAEQHDVYDLEVAYKALKSEEIKEPNLDELRKQIREEVKQELMKEIEENSNSTKSIIGGIDQNPSSQEEVKLTSKEMKIAKAMGLTPKEYAEWR